MALELTTEDKLEYQFHPVAGGSLHFKVKASNDAHVALTSGPSEADPMIEVFLGGWSNGKSAIQKNRQKPEKVKEDTPNILDGSDFKAFWIRWNGGSIAVGKQGEANPFLSWDDPEPFTVTHYGICTGWGATGEWVVEASYHEPGWNLDAVASPDPAAWTPASERTPISEPGWDLSGIESSGSATWVPTSGGEIPPNAIPAGFDNEQLYVGRAKHESGALLPGKVVPSHGVCYVPWGGAEHGITDYEVLTSCEVTWMPATDGQVPSGALPAGETEDGEPLFVGRADHEGAVSVGKVQGTHNVCYIPYGGQEVPYDQYEVLVAK